MTLIEVDHESKIIDLKTEPGDILDGSKDHVQDEENENYEDLDEEDIDFEGKSNKYLIEVDTASAT